MLLTVSWKSQKLKKVLEMRECNESWNLERSSNLSQHKDKTDAIYPQTKTYHLIGNLHNLLG